MKYIAAVVFVLSVLLVSESNLGGGIAHLGGLAMGFCFGSAMRRGRDLTAGLNRFLDFCVNLFARKPKMRVVKNTRQMTDHEWNEQRKADEETINLILEKIKKSGYNSLSSKEKKQLFGASNK